MTPAQASKRLGGYPSAYWLAQAAREERIEHTKVGRKRLFSEKNLANFIAEGLVTPRAAARSTSTSIRRKGRSYA